MGRLVGKSVPLPRGSAPATEPRQRHPNPSAPSALSASSMAPGAVRVKRVGRRDCVARGPGISHNDRIQRGGRGRPDSHCHQTLCFPLFSANDLKNKVRAEIGHHARV